VQSWPTAPWRIPWSGFVSDGPSAQHSLQRSTQALIVVGHTHEPAYFRERSVGTVHEHTPIDIHREYELDRPSILNPGAADNPDAPRWLELRLDAERRSAIWHQASTTGAPSS
jgi:hypothetical protein